LPTASLRQSPSAFVATGRGLSPIVLLLYLLAEPHRQQRSLTQMFAPRDSVDLAQQIGPDRERDLVRLPLTQRPARSPFSVFELVAAFGADRLLMAMQSLSHGSWSCAAT